MIMTNSNVSLREQTPNLADDWFADLVGSFYSFLMDTLELVPKCGECCVSPGMETEIIAIAEFSFRGETNCSKRIGSATLCFFPFRD